MRVVSFVRDGGSKAEAARRFKVGEASVYRWLKLSGLTHEHPGPKTAHKLDWEALRRHVTTHDDLTQAEAARHFGVSRQCIGNALHKMGWTRKKTTGYKERSPLHRRRFLRLRERYRRRGLQVVYIEECGFAPSGTRRYGYAPKGQRVYGRLISGHRRPRTSLIAARIGPAFEEPFLFESTLRY